MSSGGVNIKFSLLDKENKTTEAPESVHSDTVSDIVDAKLFHNQLENFDNDTNNNYINAIAEKSDDVYNLENGKKIAFIFNHFEFENKIAHRNRNGTEKDVDAIFKTFKGLGFKVEPYHDLTAEEIEEKMISVQKMENISIFVLFILSHGYGNGSIQAYDKSYDLNKSILENLRPDNCPNLAGKPKLIFVQACQGTDGDPGVMVHPRSRHASTDSAKSTASTANSEKSKHSLSYCIAHYTDFLVFDATYPGFYAIRNKDYGSWFIQALCQEIGGAKSDEDLMSILTRVTRCVVEKESKSNVTKKQVPLRQETLTRKIYLKNGNSTLNQESTTTHIPFDQGFSGSSTLTKKSCWSRWFSCVGYKDRS